MSEIMKWTQDKSIQVAKGKDGTFTIKKQRGFYYGKYVGKQKSFNFPPKKSLRELKELIKENYYWEGV